jgi:molybdopterin-binding protein
MIEYRPGEVAELLAVSVDTVRRWCDEGALSNRRSDGGHRIVAGADLARFVADHPGIHGPTPPVGSSARNRLPGLVTSVQVDGLVAVVELRCGPHRVVSLVTAEAVDDLGLEPGVMAIASVKSTNVVVERAS